MRGRVVGRPEPDARHRSLRAAARISVLSCLVALSIATVAVSLGLATHSLALVALGLESLVDAAASAVLVWRFTAEAREPHRGEGLEGGASAVLGVVLVVVAAYLVAASIRSLMVGPSTVESSPSIALAATTVCLLPWIALRKIRLARLIGSRSLRADGVLTAAGAALAAVTLVAVLIDRYAGIAAADPIAALIVAMALVPEAVGALRASLPERPRAPRP